MPPVFGLPPAIQKMSAKHASACAAESALVAFEIVHEQHAALAPNLLHAMGEAGKRHQAALDGLRCKSEGERRSDRASGVLSIVHTTQRVDAADMGNGARRTAGGAHDLPALDIEPVRQRTTHGDTNELLAGALDTVGSGRAPVVVHSDDRAAGLLHACDQALLHRRVTPQRPVPIEMVLADVDEDADGRILIAIERRALGECRRGARHDTK